MSVPFIGQSRRRVEDRRLLLGGGRYVGDLTSASGGVLHVASRGAHSLMRESRQMIRGWQRQCLASCASLQPVTCLTWDRCRHRVHRSCRVSKPSPPYRPLAADSAHFVARSSQPYSRTKLKTRWRCSTSPTNPYPRLPTSSKRYATARHPRTPTALNKCPDQAPHH